jgi:hypothetical protein
MNSSLMSVDEHRILLVAEAGAPYVSVPAGDPIAVWVDLMEVVEALCPNSPPRPPLVAFTDYRL